MNIAAHNIDYRRTTELDREKQRNWRHWQVARETAEASYALDKALQPPGTAEV